MQNKNNFNDKISINEIVGSLCNTAKKGLALFYLQTCKTLPYATTINSSGEFRLSGNSIRYAFIAQIGIGKWLNSHPEDKSCLPNLWPRIIEAYKSVKLVGDIALALWAACENDADVKELFEEKLLYSWKMQKHECNAVELGWIVQSCSLAVVKPDNITSTLEPLLNEAKDRLISLYKPQHCLFQRHDRSDFKDFISRRIACFADQVYPIIALSTYGSLFSDEKSIEISSKIVEQICRFQGPLGQWWWHYDILHGKVCEGYPVFSVHQDAMAPMAIMACDRMSKRNHMAEIERGLRWLFGKNELSLNLVCRDTGVVWRDIEKKEPIKLSRKVRSILSIAGLDNLHAWTDMAIKGFCVNYECRPYHLGWILYAWADYHR